MKEETILTKEIFNENNRTKVIGNSMYRICNKDAQNGRGQWYIHETFNDGKSWAQNNAFYRWSLDAVIDLFNMLTKEREIVKRYMDIPAPMSEDDAYNYYMYTYEHDIFSIKKLQAKHIDLKKSQDDWEKCREKSTSGARDYESYRNSERALRCAIRDILYDKLMSTLKPVPESVKELDLEMEEKKITIAHRMLHSAVRKHMGFGDSGYHNVRAFLINRVEQASGYVLKVELDGADPMSVAVIRKQK